MSAAPQINDRRPERHWRIALVFFVQALPLALFLTRISEIQSALRIDEAMLGLAFLGQPIGALLAIPFASLFIKAAGTRRLMLFGLPLWR